MLTEHPKKEYTKYGKRIDMRSAKAITCGIDIGSSSSQAVILVDGELFAHSNLQQGANDSGLPWNVLNAAMQDTGMAIKHINYIVRTGNCQSYLTNRFVNEISCHVRGAIHSLGRLSTVLIMGGENCVAIRCDETGRILKFQANACPPAYCRNNPCGGCGAAQGKGIEAVADLLGVAIEEVGTYAISVDHEQLKKRLKLSSVAEMSDRPIPTIVNSVCHILAKSQATGLLNDGWTREEVLAAYCASIARQAALLVKRIGIQKEIAVTGGVARNIGVIKELENELSVDVSIPQPNPQLTGALGAALFAMDFMKHTHVVIK